MNYFKLIDYFFRLIILIIFSIFWYSFFENREVKENRAIQQNIKNRNELPYLIDAQERLINIANRLQAQNIYMGSLRYSSLSKNRWVYFGARITIPECVSYTNVKNIIIDNGFTKDYKVKLNLTHASDYEKKTDNIEYLCKNLYFDYSYQIDADT